MKIAKEGDIVIYSPKESDLSYWGAPDLTIGEKYRVVSVDYNDYTYKLKRLNTNYNFPPIWHSWFDHRWFKTLSEIRKEKIEKINSLK